MPKIDRVVSDVRSKVEELEFEDRAASLVRCVGGDTSLIGAIVAYTHDLGNPGGQAAGNLCARMHPCRMGLESLPPAIMPSELSRPSSFHISPPLHRRYFEMNTALRDRGVAARAAMMETWGVVVHYTLKGLSKLPDIQAHVYRGFRGKKAELIAHYKKRRPIQWGAFSSTTTSLRKARDFVGSPGNGVIFKLDIATGKDIHAAAFFPMEGEILLSPAHKFLVTSETGGYTNEGFTMIDLLEQSGEWFVS